ncbi:MAG: hypothetical protein R3F62_00970 [Planctomycetota bacterium]
MDGSRGRGVDSGRLRVSPGAAPASEVVCPYCRDGFAAGEGSRRCDGCSTLYHAECAEELERCGTLGCRQSFAPGGGVPRARETPRGGVWEGSPQGGPRQHERRHAPARHRCTACHTVVPARETVFCGSCQAPYHAPCAQVTRRCACNAVLPGAVSPIPATATLMSALGLLLCSPFLWMVPNVSLILVTVVPLVVSAAAWGWQWRLGPPYWLRLSAFERLGLGVCGAVAVVSGFLTAVEGHPYEFGGLVAGAVLSLIFGATRGHHLPDRRGGYGGW